MNNKKKIIIVVVILILLVTVGGVIYYTIYKDVTNRESFDGKTENLGNITVDTKDENKYSFKAKVLTNNGNSNILVKVLEDSDFFKKNDEVNVFVDNYQFLNIYYTEDMNLEIYFDGSIEETYPPKIHTSSIGVTIPLVSMNINREIMTKDKLTIILMNNTEEDFVYGDDYLLEKMNEEKWIECETITGEPLVWNAIAYYLKSGEQKEQIIDFEYSYGELSKGRYRITKKVFEDKDIPITEDKIQKIVAEFDIE